MPPFNVSRPSPPNALMVHAVDREHPVTRGMREYFWTLNDDMYTNMKWDPQARIHVLASAFDSADSYAPERAGPGPVAGDQGKVALPGPAPVPVHDDRDGTSGSRPRRLLERPQPTERPEPSEQAHGPSAAAGGELRAARRELIPP